jgi:hypothetical protein
LGIWGRSEPITDAVARINRRISAVRIERRFRQTSATDWRTEEPDGVVIAPRC